MYCKWLIESEQAADALLLTFLTAHIPPLSSDCHYDGLVVYEGNDTGSSRHGEWYTGSSKHGEWYTGSSKHGE